MKCFAILLGLLLTGCVASSLPPPSGAEAKLFGRVDCKTTKGNAILEVEYEQAKAVCLNRADAAAVAGTTAIPIGHGAVNAVFSGIQRGSAQREIGLSTALSCMAERGYLHETDAANAARCQR